MTWLCDAIQIHDMSTLNLMQHNIILYMYNPRYAIEYNVIQYTQWDDMSMHNSLQIYIVVINNTNTVICNIMQWLLSTACTILLCSDTDNDT